MAYSATPGTYLVAVKGYYENQTLTGAFYINRFYKWKRNGVDIPGANGPSYGVTTADIGTTITCEEKVWHTVEPNNGGIDPNWTITNPLLTETPGVTIVSGSGSAAGLLGPQNITYVGSFKLSGTGSTLSTGSWNFGLYWLGVFNDGGVKKLNITAARTQGHKAGTVVIPSDAQLKDAFTNTPDQLNPATVTVQPITRVYLRHDGTYYDDGLDPRPAYGAAPSPLRNNLFADGPGQWNGTTGSPGRSLYQIPTDPTKCIVTATNTYTNHAAGLFYRRPADMTVTDPNAMEGPFVPIQTGVQENPRMHTGYMLSIPSTPVNGINYQTALNADVLAGVNSLSVVSATSDGPSMFAFKTSDITPTLQKGARGNIVAATTTTFTLDSTASTVNDFYKGFWFYIPQFMSGNPYYSTGEPYRITSYNGATKTATVDTYGVSSPISFASQTNPVRVNTETPYGGSFFDGVRVTITGVAGMTQLNGNTYYMKEVSGTPPGAQFAYRQYDLYTDASMTIPVNGTTFGTYTSGGNIAGIPSVGHYYKIFPTLEGTMLAGWAPGEMSINGYRRFEELATVWSDGSGARGMIWPAGSKSIIAIGSGNAGMFTYNGNGELVGPTTFQGDYMYNGPKIYDPLAAARGPHIFPSVGKMWAFNADDLVAVKNGDKTFRQVGPYSAWSVTYPYGSTTISGVTYDDDTRRIYIAQSNENGGGDVGTIHVYQVTTDAQTSPIAPTGITVDVSSVTGGTAGAFTTLSGWTSMTPWVDGSYTQDFWRASNVINDTIFILSRERATNRVELWMYRAPYKKFKPTNTSVFDYSWWGAGADSGAQITAGNAEAATGTTADATFDVKISVNGSLITPVYSSSTTTRVLCATGTIRRLVSAHKTWDWSKVDARITTRAIPSYNVNTMSALVEASRVPNYTATIGTKPSVAFNHAAIGGPNSSNWFDGDHSGSAGGSQAGRGLSQSWEAMAISDRKNSISTNLSNYENVLRKAAEYSGTFPQYHFLDPLTLQPHDTQKGANPWYGGGLGPGFGQNGSWYVPHRTGYGWDTAHHYNNGQLAFEATRDPYYALLLQCNAMAALSEPTTADLGELSLMLTPAEYAALPRDNNGGIKKPIPRYVVSRQQERSRWWSLAALSKAKLAADLSPTVDFLHSSSMWSTVIADGAVCLNKYNENIDNSTLPASVTTQTDANNLRLFMAKSIGCYDILITDGEAGIVGAPPGTSGHPVANYCSTFMGGGGYGSTVLVYLVAAGFTDFRVSLEKYIKFACNRVIFAGGERAWNGMGNRGSAYPILPLNNNTQLWPTLPRAFTNPTEWDAYWAANYYAWANLSKTTFNRNAASSGDFFINFIQPLKAIKALNDAGVTNVIPTDVNSAMTQYANMINPSNGYVKFAQAYAEWPHRAFMY